MPRRACRAGSIQGGYLRQTTGFLSDSLLFPLLHSQEKRAPRNVPFAPSCCAKTHGGGEQIWPLHVIEVNVNLVPEEEEQGFPVVVFFLVLWYLNCLLHKQTG